VSGELRKPSFSIVPSLEAQDRILTALPAVRDEYGLPRLRKPCIAAVLDGNLAGADRHKAAFIIAIECRDLGLTEKEAERVLTRWATKIGYRPREAHRTIRGAYERRPGGEWKYHPAGLKKPVGSHAHHVLAHHCADVGCPASCPRYQGVRQGPRGDSYRHFERLRWPQVLKRARRGAAVDTYRAICDLEDEIGVAPGKPLLTSSACLAELSGRDRSHVMENLRILYAHHGLLAIFERGSGSGPNAHDRRPTRISRAVPIPTPPEHLLAPQYRTGRERPPQIEGERPTEIKGERPHIGGAP
jgi:hypothetical protein